MLKNNLIDSIIKGKIMEQKDIIINGVSINELKKQREAIRQGAAQVISDNIDLAKTLTQQLVEAKDMTEIDNLAQQAYDALETASVVSGVSGISFYLPFYEEYRDEDEDILSSVLDENDNELLSDSQKVQKLSSMFYTMERQSRDWHSSRC